MIEMIYSAEIKREVLDTGYCCGFLYYILNLGHHPTAYVRIPEDNKFYKKDYDEIDIDVHGGLTYSSNHLFVANDQELKGWFIGWDYAHYMDFSGMYLDKRVEDIYINHIDDKKWTTEEILEDVKSVCHQLMESCL